MLARRFIKQLRPDCNSDELLTGGDRLAALSSYSWPGNVRELRNAIECLLALGELAMPQAETQSSPWALALWSVDYHQARRGAIDRFEHDYCRALLKECGGVVAHAALKAGISRQMFHRLLQRHALETP